MKEIITTKNAPAAVGAYLQAVKSGNLLFVPDRSHLIRQAETLSEMISKRKLNK